MSKQSAKSPVGSALRVLVSLISGGAVFVIIYYLFAYFGQKQVDVLGVHWGNNPFGGGGGCRTYIYDAQGNWVVPDMIQEPHKIEPDTFYVGPAPIFSHSRDSILALNLGECPQVISPDMATQGDTIYPLNIIVETERDQMRTGESQRLFAIARIADVFVGYAPVDHPVWIAEDEKRAISFSLHTPNFDYSPKNNEGNRTQLSTGLPAYAEWVIAPKPGSAGRQSIRLDIVGLQGWSIEPNIIHATIDLEVRHATGLRQIAVSLLGGIAAFIVVISQLANILKTSIDIREKLIP